MVEDAFDRETVRKCADLVQFGECITFPNGLTIDKRQVVNPINYAPVAPTTTPPYPSGGYQCAVCKRWVNPGASHTCAGWIG